MTTEAEALELINDLERWHKRNRLTQLYRGLASEGVVGGPYEWQQKFHDAGADHPERAVLAANRSGKTRTAAAEVAIHATGLYPKWWRGKRFKEPVDCIASEPTNELLRDIAQMELLGPMEAESEERNVSGMGWIPGNLIGAVGYRQCGVPNVVDTAKIKHVSGGWSVISFKSYEQGAVKFQGVARDVVWFDEEPEVEPWMIYSEAVTRILSKKGILMFTRTPLFGTTDIIRHFMSGKTGVYYTTATWDQSPHLDADAKRQMMETYAEHERDTRISGIPMMGEGAVYPVSPVEYTMEAIPIPKHWSRICGVDFGIDHPAAAAWIAHDADADIIYVYDAYRMKGQTAAYHAQAIMSRGKWIPVSWPHDGMIRDRGGGEPLQVQYRERGVNMLPVSARYDEEKGGGQPRVPATLEILERMRTGRFKVFNHLTDLLEEIRMLHRKNNIIVAERDDIESAVRYAMMMLRYSGTESMFNGERPTVTERYDPFESLARSY